jgi:outer membrane protein insertion porin family
MEGLRDYYGKDGYLGTQVMVDRRPNVQTGNIDLEYSIGEGEKNFVESIQIEGNTKTKSVVIIRELGLGPGDVFNTVRMKSSQQRLRNTRFFDEVTMMPTPTDIPDRQDLSITVKEGRTGSVTFGAGFSSLEKAIVFAEYSESNFDLFNFRSRFQGAGQKFRFRVQLGTRSNEVLLAFEEPWLFQRELALGFQIFRSETRYLASTYNELRTGFEVYLRKRLFELVEGRLSYRFEIVDIFDIDSTAADVIKEESGDRTVSKVGFSLLRDTRDSLMVTTRGNRVELLTEVAGGPFGGQTDYYRLEMRGSQFFPVFEAQTQVLSFIGRIGTVVPHSGADRIPFFDRYFLGGPYTLRGFDFRDIGPVAGAEHDRVGGNSYGFFSAEYTLTIVDPIRFAVFYDWGYVNAGDYQFDASDYNDNFGFGLRIMIMGAPLRLDYGIPITTDQYNDRGGRFSFSFGTRF